MSGRMKQNGLHMMKGSALLVTSLKSILVILVQNNPLRDSPTTNSCFLLFHDYAWWFLKTRVWKFYLVQALIVALFRPLSSR